MSDQSQDNQAKAIGFWRGWGIAVGCSIGSGIFMMPTLLAPYGQLGLLSWAVAGIGSLFIILSLSRMAKRVPKIGGPYAYAYAGLGKFAAFMIAWTYWIACVSAIAAISVAFTGYLGVFVPGLAESTLGQLFVSLALVWLLTLINLRSVAESNGLTLLTTFIKIIPLVLMIGMGFAFMDRSVFPQWNPTEMNDFQVIALATTVVMWSFLGLETATIPADNMENPSKTIPRVLISSVVTILFLYMAVSYAIAYIVPAEELTASQAPFALAASKLMGPVGAAIVTFGALVATFSASNGNLFVTPHTLVAAAKDKVMPGIFGSLNSAGIPKFALLFSSSAISILLVLNYTKGLVGAFTFMVLISTLATLMAYAFTAISEFHFFKKEHHSPLRTREMIMSGLALAYSLFVIWGAGAEAVMYGFLLILVGAPLFAFIREDTDA
ncbi:amino acid permease [Temperatibacter marinus]|uniref:Arginine/agmatine antiporter n=1 Tax=Temperatibacter marinus TaxID=1456591 RepID=A0AA52EKQ3_9PROT|nr:amino acid permease [Temperatibacter marinus]WND03791.1 amino acid permease [Temperatibacter marinus]